MGIPERARSGVFTGKNTHGGRGVALYLQENYSRGQGGNNSRSPAFHPSVEKAPAGDLDFHPSEEKRPLGVLIFQKMILENAATLAFLSYPLSLIPNPCFKDVLMD